MSELDPKDIKHHPAEDDAYDAPVDDRIIGRALLISLAVLALVFVAALGVWLGTRSEPMPVAVEEQPLQPPQPVQAPSRVPPEVAFTDVAADVGLALPESTIDWGCPDGGHIPIEERSGEEVLTMSGLDSSERPSAVRLGPAGSRARNPAFDITPAALVTALVTEHGISEASEQGLARLRRQIDSSSPM